MRKQRPLIEWTIVENDADWERQSALLRATERAGHRRHFLKRYFWSVIACLLLLVIAGDWWRRTTQAGAPGDHQLAAGVTNEQTPLSVQDRSLPDVQTTVPDPLKWGAERSLTTPFFVYHFHQNDAAAVTAVAPQIDALYPLLRQNVGLLTAFEGEKLVIDVSMTLSTGHALTWFDAPTPIRAPSPSLYVAPVELTERELLAQSIVLPLLRDVLAQAFVYHAVDPSWQPLLDGLYLWQLWDLDLPLSGWREEVVTWLYTDLPTSRADPGVVLPARYPAFCAAHKRWLPSPMLINIPLLCENLASEDFLLSPGGWYEPLTHLDQLSVPLRPDAYIEEADALRLVSHPDQTVAVATLIEYAVNTYGRERLPVLVAGLGRYESWETLLPAVYGVSAIEFEAGWQSYLMVHYGRLRR